MKTRRTMFLLGTACAIWTAAAATLRVPGDYASIQAAIDAAQPGDTIEVGTVGPFVEDLTIAKAITIKGTAAERTIVQAANTAARFAHLGEEGEDHLGAVVRAPGVRLEHLTFANLDATLNSLDISSALMILAPNCTVVDCAVTSEPINSEDGLGVGVADADLVAGGATPTGVVFEDTLFATNKYGLAVTWWVAPGIPPEVTVRNCTFSESTSSGIEMDSGNVTIENSAFVNNPATALNVGGGSATATECLFATNGISGWVAIDLNLDARWDETQDAPMPGSVPPGSLKLVSCKLWQNGAQDRSAVRVHEGSFSADHCIFTDNNSTDILIDAGGEPAAPAQLSLNHCDVHDSWDSSEIWIKQENAGQEITVDIRNSIITEGVGGWLAIENEFTDPAALERMNLSYCAIYEAAIEEAPLPGEHNLLFGFEDPPYLSTDPTAPNGFKLQPGSELLTAGEDGGYIGSNGAEKPAPPPEPVELTISIQNERPAVCWQAKDGAQYEVQSAADIVDPDWRTRATVTAEGDQACWEDAEATGPRQFYRVVSK